MVGRNLSRHAVSIAILCQRSRKNSTSPTPTFRRSRGAFLVVRAVVLFISTDEAVIDIDTNDAHQNVFIINLVETLVDW